MTLCIRFISLIISFFLFSPHVATAKDYKGVKLIAHRGAGHEFDENTVEGCQQSYSRGILGYELDVRRTRDGHLVLMHDADTSRTTDGSGRIEELTLAEIQKFRLTKSGVRVPTLEELCRFFQDKPEVYLMLEMKTSEKATYPDQVIEPYCQQLYDTAKKLLPPGTYCFISFDERALDAMHKIDSESFTGYLTATAPTEKTIASALALGCKRLSVPIKSTTQEMANQIKASGLQLSLWPIRTGEDADHAVAWGASIICSDIPSELLERGK